MDPSSKNSHTIRCRPFRSFILPFFEPRTANRPTTWARNQLPIYFSASLIVPKTSNGHRVHCISKLRPKRSEKVVTPLGFHTKKHINHWKLTWVAEKLPSMIENVSNTENGDFPLLMLVFKRGVSFGKINQAVTSILKITSFHGLDAFLFLNDCMTIVRGCKISPKICTSQIWFPQVLEWK